MLFTPENATKIMQGKKTQTRRLINPLEFCSGTGVGQRKEIYAVWVQAKSPIHKPGAYVRAPLIILERMNRLKWAVGQGYFQDKTYAVQPGRGKPALWVNWDHPCYGIDVIDDMGRARPEDKEMVKGQGYVELRIRIKSIRPEHLQDINPADCIAEGITDTWIKPFDSYYCKKPNHVLRGDFAKSWDSINGKRPGCSWLDNPQVWVLEFEPVASITSPVASASDGVSLSPHHP